MKNLFMEYGIQLSDDKISKLNSFGDYLRSVNEVMNLTTVTEKGEMWIKHFLDSILAINGSIFNCSNYSGLAFDTQSNG